MRSCRTIAIYLNGFHLLSLVPSTHEGARVPAPARDLVSFARERGERLEDTAATELGEEYFRNSAQYHDLLEQYELDDTHHELPHWSDTMCNGHLHGVCSSLRPLLKLFADTGE